MDFEKVRDIIVGTLSCDADKVTPEARLAEDLEADSLSAVELCMEIEEKFDVTIEDDDIANFKTVQDILDFLSEQA